jgi:hypothetical protein
LKPKISDYGLDAPAILKVATQLSPGLFAALATAEALKGRLPFASTDALLGAIYDEGIGEENGFRAARVDTERVFMPGFFPLTDHGELVLRLYIAASYSHANGGGCSGK